MFVLASVGFLYLQIFKLPSTPIFLTNDHWIFLEDAERMLRGEVLYRDVFQFILPGTQTVFAAMVWLAGNRLWLPNVSLLLMCGATVLLTTLAAREVLPDGLAYLPALLLVALESPAWHAASHNWFSSLAAMAAVWVLLRGCSWRRLFVAGLLCGLSAWFTQTRGAAAVLGLGAFLIWHDFRLSEGRIARFKRLCTLFMGFMIGLVGPTAYFVWRAGARRFIFCTLVYAIKYYPADRAHNGFWVWLHDLHGLRWWEGAPMLLVRLAVPSVYLVFLALYASRRRSTLTNESWQRPLLIATAGAAMLLSVAPSPSWLHVCSVSPPGLILSVWLLRQCRRPGAFAVRSLWVLGLLLAMIVVVKSFRRQALWCKILTLPTGRTAFLDPVPYEEYRWLAQHTSPGEFFFGGNNAYFYFPVGLRPVCPVLSVTPTAYTQPSQVEQVISGLEDHKVHYAIWQGGLDAAAGSPASGDCLGPLRSYLKEQYRRLGVFDRTLDGVWERLPRPTGRNASAYRVKRM